MQLSSWVKNNIPIVVALTVSALVIGVVFHLALESLEGEGQPMNRWSAFFQLAPNAMGDTLAGVFGALTLVWVIASVFHQSSELTAQRKELARVSEATAAQVEALKAQTLIFQDEKKRRDEAEIARIFEYSLPDLTKMVQNLQQISWKVFSLDSSGAEVENDRVYLLGGDPSLGLFQTEDFSSLAVVLSATHSKLKKLFKEDHRKVEISTVTNTLRSAQTVLIAICSLRQQLDLATGFRIDRLGLGTAADILEQIWSDKRFCEPTEWITRP